MKRGRRPRRNKLEVPANLTVDLTNVPERKRSSPVSRGAYLPPLKPFGSCLDPLADLGTTTTAQMDEYLSVTTELRITRDVAETLLMDQHPQLFTILSMAEAKGPGRHGVPHAKIAERLGITVRQVGYRLEKARNLVQEAINEDRERRNNRAFKRHGDAGGDGGEDEDASQ